MNLIKSPRELLFEYAGVPAMAGGGIAPHGIRHSGLGVKHKGFYGPQEYKGETDNLSYEMSPKTMATEISVETDDMGDYPLMVPGLTKDELDSLLSGGAPTERMQRLAREHAEKRAKQGKSPFAGPTELRYPIPKMAGGGIMLGKEMLEQFAGQIVKAIQQYKKLHGKDPDPADVQALREHVMSLGKKPEIKTDPVTQARARHQLATDPNISSTKAPDISRDPFLTQATTGRTVRGTYQKPKVQDIADPNVQKNIEMKQQAGELEDIMPESITPSADYIGRMGTAVENQALAAGKDMPLIDKLKAAFYERYKRFPTDEEMEVIIAEFNPTRHQYGTKGASIVGERPPTAKGLEDWRQRARTEGIEEAYLVDSPRKYPKYLKDELEILQGRQPSTKLTPESMSNPDRISRSNGGSTAMTPDEMRAAMAVRGYEPGKYVNRTKEMLSQGAKKVGKAGKAAITIPAKLANKALNVANPVFNVYQLYETGKDIKERAESGDYPGAAISTIAGVGYGAGSLPGTGFLGSGVGLTADFINYLRDKGIDLSDVQQTVDAANPLYKTESEQAVTPRYRSVMEDYK